MGGLEATGHIDNSKPVQLNASQNLPADEEKAKKNPYFAFNKTFAEVLNQVLGNNLAPCTSEGLHVNG